MVFAQPPAGSAGLPEGVKAFRDLAYVENGHALQKLDLFVPENAQGPLPLIIWVHGGGWQSGSKEGCPPARQGYLRRGYAVASLNYRLSGNAVFPAQIEDCKAGVRWLRAHAKEYGLDPDRFGVWGSSAGGHLVALLGTSGDEKSFDVGPNLGVSSRVQAVCDYYGPTDLSRMDERAAPGARLKHNDPKSPESALLGGPVQENREKAARASPLSYVTTHALPPFLIVHGDIDPVVSFDQSELLFAALKAAGGNVHLHCIKGAGHGQGFGGKEVDERVSGFFDRWLKAAAQPAPETARTESAAVGPVGGPGSARRRP
jgi:acetyl esterase/lipase